MGTGLVPPPTTEPVGEATLAGAYFLLADLLEWGPMASLRDVAMTSPILSEALGQVDSQDELEASHTTAFGLHVFPYAGVFLDPGGQAGAGASALFASYRELRFDPAAAGPGVDHLATVFRALGHANARAVSLHRDAEEAPLLRARTRSLLDRHVLSWLPAWVSAVRRLGQSWPTALAVQAIELALLHRQGLGEGGETAPKLAPLPDLDAKETDLRTIAHALTTPAIAGLFLSRRDVSALARSARAPTGFGPRSLLLENALQSAARYDTLPAIADHIGAIYREWQRELDVEYARAIPGLKDATAPWRQRAAEAAGLLRRIRSAARNAAA